MLVIIVVSAATLLAAFVASYQKQLQTEESFTHDQNLESIHVLSLNTSTVNGRYATFGFTIASEYVNPSIVLGISINNQPLRFFNWTDQIDNTSGAFSLGGQLNVSSFAQVYISLDLNSSHNRFSFFNASNAPTPNNYLKFDIFTYLQNDFERIFLPPTALAVVSEVYPTSTNPAILLDGSTSFQGGTNTSIVQWSWLATNQSNHTESFPLFGEEVEAPVNATSTTAFNPGTTYWVNLTVTNSAGLVGTTGITYKVPT